MLKHNVAKNFDILATSLSVLHNYFDGLMKLFSNQYLAKFLDFAKSFFARSSVKKFNIYIRIKYNKSYCDIYIYI